ncbi:MAG: acyl-CoA dehydratase activase [Oscillochloridaceae bacterium]|nr:acyl-CoA dehydratase activase [Chloroflexaceae bacterium]MDW8390763.1 acyl-CoA dehydratase activase [Oscillochloridaceae bacterium]
MAERFIGIDVGSTTVKVVLLDETGAFLTHRYRRSNGQPRATLIACLNDLAAVHNLAAVAGVCLTGSGGEAIARLIGCRHVNELITQTRAVGALYPAARSVIEIGGQDSKFLVLEWDATTGQMRLVDFAMNSLCAAGTGSFLDQQAERLGIAIEGEFARLALQSRNPARIAGRCTVFAKSDMIHLQQQGRPLPDILAGLCLALARNFKSVVARGKPFTPPILFQGGVAYNQAVVRAFETVLELAPGELIVPERHEVMAALGAALIARDDAERGSTARLPELERLEAVLQAPAPRRSMPPLRRIIAAPATVPMGCAAPDARLPAYLGIDVGSISTKLALVEAGGRVIARRYLLTAGRPLEAVQRGLRELWAEVGDRVEVCGVGTTGSGRYLTADFVGADVVRNEIAAQARAAMALDPTVDTIFEIGGQDSKYIRLAHGAVVDFAMNSACAAGTGSFLEEQADRLRISVRREFSELAFAAGHPAALGERCTVFMESDLVHHQQQGAGQADLVGGLAYAVAQNYLNRVVAGRPLGTRIFFQGGVAANQAVVAAFEALTGRTITVPPHHDVTGAIGAALLAREELARHGNGAGPPTRFRGFDLSDRHYATSTFVCQACPNLCEVNRVTIASEPPIFYGALCDRFEEAGRARSRAADLPDHFAERQRLWLGDYREPERRPGRLRIGLPRSLIVYDMFPYWRAFFALLGMDVVLSAPTSPALVRRALEHAAAETCFPVKLAFGHALDLLDKDVDRLFVPVVVSREDPQPGQEESNYCPFIPATAYMVAAHLSLHGREARPILGAIRFHDPAFKRHDLRRLARQLGVSLAAIEAADAAGNAAQQAFYAALEERGRAALAALPPGRPAAVLVGHPYNTNDPRLCLDLPYKLRKLGVVPIPLDYLPVRGADLSDEFPRMYWRGGQEILAAGRIIRDDPRLQAIVITNFGCGPDSFLLGYFKRIMGDKPFLELEIDEHTADAGIITRCEAFFDSLRMRQGL